MNFAELRFWEYLVAGLLAIGAIRWVVHQCQPARLPLSDKLSLAGLGLFLLFCVSWVTLIIYLVVAIGTYVGLAWVLRHHARHAFKYLALLIPLQLTPLFFFKYTDFAVNRVLGLDIGLLQGLVIPVGISFYTFQKVAFVIDTLALEYPMPRFLDYMNFAGFFPQIVAGPIERRNDLLPQMERFHFAWSAANINEGAVWIVVGMFFKCCLADNLAACFDRSSTTNVFLIWMANLVFGLRIYYDFAGYSLTAVGLARCLGVRLTLNFLSPYCSTSITEFWRRWHITLSQWFRDYVFFPTTRQVGWVMGVAVMFIVSGIWHGAGWNFVLWGGLHGACLIIHRLAGKKVQVPTFLAWTMTMLICFCAWLCFYELRIDLLRAKLLLIFNPAAYNWSALKLALHYWPPGEFTVLLGFLALAGCTLLIEWLSIRWHNEPYHYLKRPWALPILIVLAVLLAPGTQSSFIYFAF